MLPPDWSDSLQRVIHGDQGVGRIAPPPGAFCPHRLGPRSARVAGKQIFLALKFAEKQRVWPAFSRAAQATARLWHGACLLFSTCGGRSGACST
jgi:hypothetical protein